MSGRSGLDLQIRFSPNRRVPGEPSERKLRVLAVGGFAGDSSGLAELSLQERPVLELDIDSIDEVFERYTPWLNLELFPDRALSGVGFRSLDDFHPDLLSERHPIFEGARALQEGLKDPSTSSQTIDFVLGPKDMSESGGPKSGPKSGNVGESDGKTLERILGQVASSQRSETRSRHLDLSELLADVVKPFIVDGPDDRLNDARIAVDKAATRLMRAILHHPKFQALEALWRMVYRTACAREVSRDLEVSVLHATKEELADHVRTGRSFLSVGRTGPGGPWDMVVADYTFGATDADFDLLEGLVEAVSPHSVPFVAAADSSLIGCHSLLEAPHPRDWNSLSAEHARRWDALRRTPGAECLGLALPRLLTRMPYGRGSDEIEAFEFEELADPQVHEHYLWGNPALALPELVAIQGWAGSGLDQLRGGLDLDDLPAFVYATDAGKTLIPCAEVFLVEQAAQVLVKRGIMPLMSHRDRPRVRWPHIASIAG